MPERITLVDKNGQRQPASIPRHELPIHQTPGLYVEASIAVVQNSLGQFVVHRRAKGKTHENHYDHVCGAAQTHLEVEMPEHTARRELFEEYGLFDTDVKTITYIESGVNTNKIYRHLFRIALVASAKPRIIRPREITSIESVDQSILYAMRDNGVQFIDGFFSDLEAIMRHRF